jgi:hypothetical protein
VPDSGRVIFAAAAVMAAVFVAFALSGPLPGKAMASILGVSVLLDAMLVRLVLLAALMRALGQHAWALPRPRAGAACRPLRTRVSTLTDPTRPGVYPPPRRVGPPPGPGEPRGGPDA